VRARVRRETSRVSTDRERDDARIIHSTRDTGEGGGAREQMGDDATSRDEGEGGGRRWMNARDGFRVVRAFVARARVDVARGRRAGRGRWGGVMVTWGRLWKGEGGGRRRAKSTKVARDGGEDARDGRVRLTDDTDDDVM